MGPPRSPQEPIWCTIAAMSWATFSNAGYEGAVIGGVIFALSLAVAAAVAFAVRFVAARLDTITPYGIGGVALRSVRNSLVAFVVVIGGYVGLDLVEQLDQWHIEVQRGFTILGILIGAHALSAGSSATLNWYMTNIAAQTETTFDDRSLPLLRRFLRVAIYGLALVLILDTLGYSIGLLLGGLGITGLAVALALQPTLTNYFAGTYVMSDQAIKSGDYIELQGGSAGYVVDVGWRTTKIRTWLNTLVIIPNSVMADTIITNYQGPDPALNILVYGGVSYASDLQHVEDVSLDVTRSVIADNDEAVKSMDPWFGYDSFGDSNVNFWIFLQATDRVGSFVVTNDLIKRLHARFAAESIEINYPVRKIVFGEEPPGESS